MPCVLLKPKTEKNQKTVRKTRVPSLSPQWVHTRPIRCQKAAWEKPREETLWILASRLSSLATGMDLPNVSLLAQKKRV